MQSHCFCYWGPNPDHFWASGRRGGPGEGVGGEVYLPPWMVLENVRPRVDGFWELFWEPFGTILAPIRPYRGLLGLPGASLGLPGDALFGDRFSMDFLMLF